MHALLAQAADRLRAAPIFGPDKPDETPEATASALWTAAGECCGPEATPVQAFEQLLLRRLAGEPLAYLVGHQEFMGLRFAVAPGALIPRRETELLGQAARAIVLERPVPPRVLDLCTGCGNLAITMAVARADAEVVATDLDPDALALAARNVALHQVAPRVRLCAGDLFEALPADEGATLFDVILCNPPYLPSRHARAMPPEIGGHEPVAAFDGGALGVSILLRLISDAPSRLVPGGWLCFEFGAGQGPFMARRIAALGAYADSREVTDAAGVARAMLVRTRPAA